DGDAERRPGAGPRQGRGPGDARPLRRPRRRLRRSAEGRDGAGASGVRHEGRRGGEARAVRRPLAWLTFAAATLVAGYWACVGGFQVITTLTFATRIDAPPQL